MRSALWLIVALALVAIILYLIAIGRADVACPPDRPILVEDGSCVAPEFFETERR